VPSATTEHWKLRHVPEAWKAAWTHQVSPHNYLWCHPSDLTYIQLAPKVPLLSSQMLLPNARYLGIPSLPRSRDRTALLLFQGIPALSRASEVDNPEAGTFLVWNMSSNVFKRTSTHLVRADLDYFTRLRQLSQRTVCLISTSAHSQSRNIPTPTLQTCFPQGASLWSSAMLYASLFWSAEFRRSNPNVFTLCLGRANDLQTRGEHMRHTQPCQIYWIAGSGYPCSRHSNATMH